VRLQIGFLIIAPIRLAGRGGSVHRPPFLAGYPLDTSGEAGRNRSSGVADGLEAVQKAELPEPDLCPL